MSLDSARGNWLPGSRPTAALHADAVSEPNPTGEGRSISPRSKGGGSGRMKARRSNHAPSAEG